ncbi:uncharacterized protein LOC116289227, partial [Actinia tenebrosa]|uniref:Uncharacterized protein LOC116289227 n=1 Tax=Actinia tenebrosa TaxID=6105 RepID=A0A6P8H8X7_ACTTE
MLRGLLDDVREKFPNVDLTRLNFQTGDKGQIQIQYQGRDKWYDLYQRRDSDRLTSNLPKEIKNALGRPNLMERLRENDENTNEAFEKFKTLMQRQQKGAEAMREVEGLKETMEEREAEYMRQNRLLLDAQKRELNDKNQRIIEMREQTDKALRDRDQAQKAFELALQDLDISKEEAKNLRTTIAGSLEERRQ